MIRTAGNCILVLCVQSVHCFTGIGLSLQKFKGLPPARELGRVSPQYTSGSSLPEELEEVPPQELEEVVTGVRFSLFPNVHRDVDNDPKVPASLREVVRGSLKGLDELGVEVLQDGVMTSCLLGPDPALFEALRVCFGRASRGPGGLPRQVSLQCTFFAEGLDEPREMALPPRSVVALQGKEFVSEAYALPSRVACQFSVYPLGTTHHKDIINKVKDHAKQHYSVWKEGETPFSSALEGSGIDVFDAMRSCFAVAREESNGQDVVMTATLTGNKRQWTNDFFERTCND